MRLEGAQHVARLRRVDPNGSPSSSVNVIRMNVGPGCVLTQLRRSRGDLVEHGGRKSENLKS